MEKVQVIYRKNEEHKANSYYVNIENQDTIIEIFRELVKERYMYVNIISLNFNLVYSNDMI